jgi:MoxR-like ATPase
MSNIKVQILSLGSTTAICGAAQDLLGINTLSKIEAVNKLAEKIEAGYFDLTAVKQAIADRNGAANPQATAASNAVAIRAESTALAVKAELSSLAGEFGATRIDLNKRADSLEKAIYTLRDRADIGVSEYNRINLDIASISKDLNGAHASAARAENLAAQALDAAKARAPAIGPDPAEVAQAVAAAVAAAFKPFEQAVIDAGAQAQVGAMVAAQLVGSETALDLFEIPLIDSKLKPVEFQLWNHPEAPAIDWTFIWTEPVLQHLAFADKHSLNLWFGGAKGTGKTISAQQFAARTGRKFVRINFHKFTEPSDYLGGTGIANGNTEFQIQDFLSAYTTPGCVILLDEISNASPGCLAPLNALLEPNAAVNIGGHVWRKAPGTLVIAADNTMGNGDDSGRYAGTQTQNSAFGERFSASHKFEYLPLAKEIQAVVNHTGCNPALAGHILGAVNLARSKVDTGDIVDAPSIRCVIAYIRALAFMSPAQAWASCIAARQPIEGQAALEAIRLATIDEATIYNFI